jgi:hypothetical protein
MFIFEDDVKSINLRPRPNDPPVSSAPVMGLVQININAGMNEI